MDNFQLEYSTIWSFPDRGSWLNHIGDYPGNWSPYVPRNIILRYSKEGEIVLDQFVGSGTTLIEAKALKRKSIGCDVNMEALKIAKIRQEKVHGPYNPIILRADARNLINLKDNSVDLICTHPPYANIIKYSKDLANDISLLDIDDFYISMGQVARECFRVLKYNKYCAILMGDTRKHGYIVPLGFNVMNIFIKAGFRLKEIIIKEQHNCKSLVYWKNQSIKNNFYLIAHEYLFVFTKYGIRESEFNDIL